MVENIKRLKNSSTKALLATLGQFEEKFIRGMYLISYQLSVVSYQLSVTTENTDLFVLLTVNCSLTPLFTVH